MQYISEKDFNEEFKYFIEAFKKFRFRGLIFQTLIFDRNVQNSNKEYIIEILKMFNIMYNVWYGIDVQNQRNKLKIEYFKSYVVYYIFFIRFNIL